MTERITQEEIYTEAENHLRGVASLLERMGGGGAEQVAVGYVEGGVDGSAERFTELGWETVRAAQSIALASAAHLWEVGGRTTMSQDAALLNKVQACLAVTATTLKGMEADVDAAGCGPTWVATGLRTMLNELKQKAEDNGGAEEGGGIVSRPDDTREEFVNQLAHLNAFLTVLAWYERKDFFPLPGDSVSAAGLPSEVHAFALEVCLPQALKTAQLAHAVQAGGILTDEPDWEVWEDATVGAVSAYGSLAAALEGGGPLNGTDLIDAAQYFVRRATIATLTAVNKQIAEHIEGGKEPTGDREEVPHV